MVWLENLFSEAMVERLGWMLVHFLWQAAVVAMLLAVFLRLLRRSSANVRYLTACAAIVLMVLLPIVTMQFIEVPGPAAEAGPEPEPYTAPVATTPGTIVQRPEEMFTPPDILPETAGVATAVPWSQRITLMLEPALPYVVLGWLVGVFGLSAWHLGGWMQLQRLKRRMVHRVGDVLQQRLARIADRLGVSRAVPLLESALVEVPTVVGWLRPVILLPASALTGLSPDQLEAVLAHELAHIRRYDYLVNVLQTIVEILGFYHPAVWWVSRRIRIERENCCDDIAVHVCGDSVRYARALTYLEEIRHSQAELAMAATGGSLLDRIARLLGRPAADDRRFTWLPGLITLLLVAGVVIPAALALAGADARSSEPPADDAAAMIDAPQAETGLNEPNRAQILLDFYIAEAFSDARLDQDTAAQVVDLLVRIPAFDAPPTIEELQKPLADVFARFAPKPGKSRHLLDRLVSKGYAQIMCNPRLQVFAGQEGSIAMGSMPDPNATEAENRERTFMRLTVTASDVPDQNATKLEIDFTRAYPTYKPGEPSQETTMATIRSMLVAPNDQYTSISERMVKRVDEKGRERMVLAFVKPAVVQSPEASSSVAISDPSASEPNAAEAGKAYVQVGVKIVKVVDGSELDRETVLKIEDILGKRVRPEGRAGEFGPRFHLTLGEVFRNHVLGQPLPREMLDALLPLFKDIEVLAAPQVMAREGEKCQIKVASEEYFWMGSSTDGSTRQSELQKVEIGTTVDLTSHVGDHNDVTMEIGVETSDLLPRSTGADIPVVTRRTARAFVTTLNNQCIIIAGVTADDESVYIMATPTIVEPPAVDNDASSLPLGMGGMGGFREPPGDVNAGGVADPAANEPQVAVDLLMADVFSQKRLDPRTATEAAKLLAETTLKPTERDLGKPLGEILQQYTENQALSGRPLEAFVDLLFSRGYARRLAHPMVTMLDRQPAQIESGHDIDALDNLGTLKLALGVTPKANPEKNMVFLELHLEVERQGTGEPPTQTPKRTIHTVHTTALVKNAESIAVPRMSQITWLDKQGNERMLFVTAKPAIVPPADNKQGRAATTQSHPEAANAPELPVTATFANVDLREVLAEISRRGRASVVADETVKPQAVTAELAGVSVEESLRRILTDTPYVFKKIGESTIARQERPRITNIWQGDQLRLVLQDIATMAGVPIITDDTVAGSVYADLKDVSLETALEMVLAGTPYVIRKTPDYYFVASRDRRAFEEESSTSPWPQGTYLVYRPIGNIFMGENRRQALMDLAAIAGISIAVDENVTGEVSADLNNVPLETALRMVTAGGPYVVKKKADHYEVTRQKTPPESGTRSDSGASGSPQADETRRRSVLLDTRIVKMKRRDLAGLGIEWAQRDIEHRYVLDRGIEWAQGNAARAATASTAKSDARIGRLPDRASTDSLLAKLDVLKRDNRADILANPQVITKEGERTKIQQTATEYFNPPPGMLGYRVIHGPGVSVIPYVEDGNISLSVTDDVNDLMPPVSITPYADDTNMGRNATSEANAHASLVIVRSNAPRTAITVRQGGTGVLVVPEPITEGVPMRPASLWDSREKGDPERIYAVFFTASLVDEANAAATKVLSSDGTDSQRAK